MPFGVWIAVFDMRFGLATVLATTPMVTSLPSAKQGVVAAVNDACRELGAALGVGAVQHPGKRGLSRPHQ